MIYPVLKWWHRGSAYEEEVKKWFFEVWNEPNLSNQKEYIRLRDEKPNNSLFTRKEIASHGFAPDMIKNTGLIQFWIDVCAHLCLKELSKYDENSASYYQKGLLSNGEVAIKFCDINKMLKYFGCLRCLIMVAKHAHIEYDAAMELINRQRKDLMPYIDEAVSLFKRADEFFV